MSVPPHFSKSPSEGISQYYQGNSFHTPSSPSPVPLFPSNIGYPTPYPVNMPIYTDPNVIRQHSVPCIAVCPYCSYTGLTLVTIKANIGFLILGLLLIPLAFSGIFIIIFLVPERTHMCCRCGAEIARKSKLSS